MRARVRDKILSNNIKEKTHKTVSLFKPISHEICDNGFLSGAFAINLKYNLKHRCEQMMVIIYIYRY